MENAGDVIGRGDLRRRVKLAWEGRSGSGADFLPVMTPLILSIHEAAASSCVVEEIQRCCCCCCDGLNWTLWRRFDCRAQVVVAKNRIRRRAIGFGPKGVGFKVGFWGRFVVRRRYCRVPELVSMLKQLLLPLRLLLIFLWYPATFSAKSPLTQAPPQALATQAPPLYTCTLSGWSPKEF